MNHETLERLAPAPAHFLRSTLLTIPPFAKGVMNYLVRKKFLLKTPSCFLQKSRVELSLNRVELRWQIRSSDDWFGNRSIGVLFIDFGDHHEGFQVREVLPCACKKV